jgi:hypothetical protein
MSDLTCRKIQCPECGNSISVKVLCKECATKTRGVKKGDLIRYKQSYTTQSGIIISPNAIGEVMDVHDSYNFPPFKVVEIHFDIQGIIIPVSRPEDEVKMIMSVYQLKE